VNCSYVSIRTFDMCSTSSLTQSVCGGDVEVVVDEVTVQLLYSSALACVPTQRSETRSTVSALPAAQHQTKQLERACRPSVDILCGRPPHLSPFELKIGTAVTHTLRNVRTNFFSTSFRFRDSSQYGTDDLTDKQTDGQDEQDGRIILTIIIIITTIIIIIPT